MVVLVIVISVAFGFVAGHLVARWGIESRLEEVMSLQELQDLNSRIKERFG